ncbi:MAG TPA: response regulator transcription factor [Terriglobia bacterium]|jgi:two-component system alkaline phosphatase synthesis response regulator PhoP
MNKAHILLVEDEANLRRTVSDLLKSDGYTVQSSGDGLEAQQLAMSQPFDLIILDVMLPSKNGFDVCRHLRKNGVNTPILMLTARTELNNKVLGFKAGGDDYLTKPFDTPELQARVEALLRRAPAASRPELKTYEFDGIHVDFTKGRVIKHGKSTDLGERECRLLRYLVERKGSVLSRDELLQEVWGYKSIPLTRTVDVHVAWLRQKIEDDPKNPQYIVTVHGQGYRFSG